MVFERRKNSFIRTNLSLVQFNLFGWSLNKKTLIVISFHSIHAYLLLAQDKKERGKIINNQKEEKPALPS